MTESQDGEVDALTQVIQRGSMDIVPTGISPPPLRWIDLHKWARDYCAKKNITHTQFLTECKLEAASTFLQYISAGGSTRKLSTKKGTQGRKLIDAITALKHKVDAGEVIPESPLPDARRILDEQYLEVVSDLQANGIISYHVESVDPLALAGCSYFTIV